MTEKVIGGTRRITCILVALLILTGWIFGGCSGGGVKYIQENPNLLKPGLWAKSFLQAWGPPDETFTYKDYKDKQFSSSSGFYGSDGWVGGSSSAKTYTPTYVVWIYREKKKALFFQQVPLLNEQRNPLSTMVWKLVGWENLKYEKISPDEDKARQTKAPEIRTVKDEAYADPIFIKSIPLEIIKPSDLIQKSIQAVVTIKTEGGHASGFLISDDGYLITSFHTISGKTFIDVLLPNKIMLQAEVVRVNQDLDLALLKLKGTGFSALTLGNSDKIQLGEEVFGIGTPASIELGQSVSKGIISGVRKIEEKEYIQTDAKVNPGNSGGPLINPRGEVIGIITMKIVGKGYEGLAFCIPINVAAKSLNLISK
jgi:S1-C subfamily serine protease